MVRSWDSFPASVTVRFLIWSVYHRDRLVHIVSVFFTHKAIPHHSQALRGWVCVSWGSAAIHLPQGNTLETSISLTKLLYVYKRMEGEDGQGESTQGYHRALLLVSIFSFFRGFLYHRRQDYRRHRNI